MTTEISENDLIEKHLEDTDFFHISKSPIVKNSFNTKFPQLQAFGFNVGGRPDGMWISRGSTWMSKSKSLNNPLFLNCCYVYKITLKPNSRILQINNEKEFNDFDKNFPNYWLNFDYFEMEFVDYLTGNVIKQEKKRELNLDKLCRRPGETLTDILINNKIIFTEIASAMEYCEFYKTIPINIHRFKYKNWAGVAEKYQAIIFDSWENYGMQYLWYQSLDVKSGCIWDTNCIAKIDNIYCKINDEHWKFID